MPLSTHLQYNRNFSSATILAASCTLDHPHDMRGTHMMGLQSTRCKALCQDSSSVSIPGPHPGSHSRCPEREMKVSRKTLHGKT